MIRAHSVDAVRAAEAAAMADLPPGELMARAALGLAEVAAARLTDTGGTTVVGLVGAGDNGGDTLYAVAHLAESGFACAVVLLPATGRGGVHADGLEAAEAAGAVVHVAEDDPDAAADVVAEADVVLDGIVGTPPPPGSWTPSTTTPG
jgi:NAD(P)H-hydrate repair Nnr-like enzyme with NAD(P)H-hydrate epimerase domain